MRILASRMGSVTVSKVASEPEQGCNGSALSAPDRHCQNRQENKIDIPKRNAGNVSIFMAFTHDAKCNILKLLQATWQALDDHLKRAAEAQGLYEAKDFWRFVSWSILPMLESLPNEIFTSSSAGVYPRSLADLKAKLKELERMTSDQFNQPDFKPKWERREIDALHHKLDLLAGAVAGQRDTLAVLQSSLGQAGGHGVALAVVA